MAAGHLAVVDAASAMLACGGNAYDAVIAAGFAATVAEPGYTSLGGGGFVLARTDAGEEVLFDFFVDTPGRGLSAGRRLHFEPVEVRFPAAVQTFHCGLGSVAVPGALAGLLHVHRRLGRLPLRDVVAPAVALADAGVTIAPSHLLVLAILEPILRRHRDMAAIFFPDGRPIGPGDRLHNPDLARFIEEVGNDPVAGFYRGPVADRLVSAMAAGDGLVTSDDLTSYRVIEREPLAVEYRGRRVLTNPAPSFGGRLIGVALGLLEGNGPLPAHGSPDRAVALAEVMIEVDRRRAEDHPPSTPTSVRGTTHVSVADAEGNVAAMTTSNGECSGHLIEGTGVLLNNMLGEDDLHPDGFHAAPPGGRVASMMSPTIVVGPGGEVELVLGSGGSKRIRTAILQVLSHVIDGTLPIADAVNAPRLHWDLDHLEIEPGMAADVVERLSALAPVNLWPARNLFFGGVHSVAPGKGAAGDPRRDGTSRRIPVAPRDP